MKRVSSQDVLDALDHVSDFEGSSQRSSDYLVSDTFMLSFEELADYDDVNAWLEWSSGELRGLAPAKLAAELKSFRGAEWAQRAKAWKRPELVPPVVVVAPSITVLGDGRGRVSYAVGMGWKSVPAVVATRKK